MKVSVWQEESVDVEKVVTQFWFKYRRILERVYLELEDTQQQAALIVAEGQVDQLWCRLIDWMRCMTQYDHHKKRRPHYCHYDDLAFSSKLATTRRQEDRRAEGVNVARVTCERAASLGPRSTAIIHAILDGENSNEVARKLHLSEGRISQMLKQITRSVVVSSILLLSAISISTAQTPPCLTASWSANTEPDLGGYHLTITEDGVAQPVLTYPVTATKSDCVPKNNAEYEIGLTAFDTSGNESAPTTVQKDFKAPATPTGLQITINVSVTVP